MQKKLMVTAVALAALMLAAVALGGCKLFGLGGPETDDGTDKYVEEGWTYSVSGGDIEVDESIPAEALAQSYTLKLLTRGAEGYFTVSGIPVGEITNGKMTFALPAEVDEDELSTLEEAELLSQEELEEWEGVLDPPNGKLLWVTGLAVYSGDNLVARLEYKKESAPATVVTFLYSAGPLTINYMENGNGKGMDVQTVPGWNPILEVSPTKVNGLPPSTAKWYLMEPAGTDPVITEED